MESTTDKCKTPLGVGLAAAIWLIVISTVMVLIMRYSVSPGSAGSPPSRFPQSSKLTRLANKPILLLFVHPRCPCSRATLGELELLLAQCQSAVEAKIIFIKPSGTPEGWTETDLWRTAVRMRGATPVLDEGGLEAHRFGAETSGIALLYNPSGDLVFQGGLTGERGHSGDNAGRDAVTALIHGTVTHSLHTPVFGCPLFDVECAENSKIQGGFR